MRGNRNAEVFIIEYSDLECPFCARFHQTAQKAVDEYDGKVAWVFMHFPLSTIHPRAEEAAQASECVAELGGENAFWEFTDTIFENQSLIRSLDNAAVDVGVNKSTFDLCLSSGRHESIVEEHYESGIKAGVTGTPGNFVVAKNGNAWIIPGAVPYDTLETTIEAALGN